MAIIYSALIMSIKIKTSTIRCMGKEVNEDAWFFKSKAYQTCLSTKCEQGEDVGDSNLPGY